MTGKRLFLIGEVTGVHGLKGYLKVKSHAESIETYKPGIMVLLQSSLKEDKTWYEISKSSLHKRGVLLSLKGVDNIDTAQALRGSKILIKRDDLPEPEENAYFWQDLLGLEVIDKRRGSIGKIDNIIQTGANDVFVVKRGIDTDKDKGETLVPAIASVIIKVNIKEGTIEIDLPEGL